MVCQDGREQHHRRREVANLLQQTSKEEKAADQKLTQLAESGINKSAAEEVEA